MCYTFLCLLQYTCGFLLPRDCGTRWSDSKNRVLTIKKRPILGTIIAYSVAAASSLITIPPVAIELDTNLAVQTVEAHEYPKDVEGIVRSYFKDIPILAEVARCESTFTHIDPETGTVKRGHMNSSDLGVMQINEYYHGERAARLGYEITKLEDNLAYARYLYEKEGVQPWSASQHCWRHNLLAMR